MRMKSVIGHFRVHPSLPVRREAVGRICLAAARDASTSPSPGKHQDQHSSVRLWHVVRMRRPPHMTIRPDGHNTLAKIIFQAACSSSFQDVVWNLNRKEVPHPTSRAGSCQRCSSEVVIISGQHSVKQLRRVLSEKGIGNCFSRNPFEA